MLITHFIGYATAEQWLEACDKTKLVFAEAFTHPGRRDSTGCHSDQEIIFLAQIDELGHVHYCRIPVAVIQYVGESPLSSDAPERLAAAKQAWKIVKSWLTESGCLVRHAVVATPRDDLMWLDGWPDFLHYDRATKSFTRNEQVAV